MILCMEEKTKKNAECRSERLVFVCCVGQIELRSSNADTAKIAIRSPGRQIRKKEEVGEVLLQILSFFYFSL